MYTIAKEENGKTKGPGKVWLLQIQTNSNGVYCKFDTVQL